MRTLSPDTRPEAEDAHIELLRTAGPARRGALALSLSSFMIRQSRKAVARRFPELPRRDVLLRWVELHYGRELAERVRAHLRTRA